jgi:hypothetical protein
MLLGVCHWFWMWGFVTKGSISQLVILNCFMKEKSKISLNSFAFTEKW